MTKKRNLSLNQHLFFILVLLVCFLLCISLGSVRISLSEIVESIGLFFIKGPQENLVENIIFSIRLPRVLNVFLVGGGLSLCGAAMQGLLKNPLADGSTMGVSSGAALGAIIAIALGLSLPGIPFGGTVLLSIIFAFLSLISILSLSYKIDTGLSTNTIILMGVIFSMFASSISSFIMVFASKKIESITFWQMGSLANSSYISAIVILFTSLFFGYFIIKRGVELDAFSMGENNALHLGVDVKRTKLTIMVSVSAIIGVCVAFSGTIAFVGLILPHIMRKVVGVSHRKLLIASYYGGGIFLLLADLFSRTILSPIEIPIGIVTSSIGSLLFVYIFYRMRKG